MDEKCGWASEFTEDSSGKRTIFRTACNNMHVIINDWGDVDFKYCPYCGKKIKENK